MNPKERKQKRLRRHARVRAKIKGERGAPPAFGIPFQQTPYRAVD